LDLEGTTQLLLEKNTKLKVTLRASLLAALCLLFVFCLGIQSFPAETYPQIDVTGYKKYEYSSLNVDEIRNIFAAQAMLGGYYGGGPWQERLKLRIVGKLTEKLSVSYDLEQQPEMPDKFDVKVTYDKTELTFGDFQANFSGNEFVSTSKFLNGVMVTSKDNWYDLTFVPSAKLKSETQGLVSQKGANTKGPYNLGHGSIIEGSEHIELNNVPLKNGVDYTIDYFSGKITFSRILSGDDEFKYSYEFTNLIDLFFPTVSKRDFVGLQMSTVVDPTLLGMPAKRTEKLVKKASEFFPSSLEIPKELITNEVIKLQKKVNIIPSYESVNAYIVYMNNTPVITLHDISGEAPAQLRAEAVKNRLDSLIEGNISSGEISTSVINGEHVVLARGRGIVTASMNESKIYKIPGDLLAILWKENIISGLMSTPETITKPITPEINAEYFEWESTGTYKLNNIPVIPYSEKITYMGTQLKIFEDYLINYQDGTVTFLRPNLPTYQEPLMIEYDYIDVAEESETLPGAGKGPYSLAQQDIIEGSESVYVNNIPYIRNLDYSIDYTQGKIMFYSNIPQTANVVVKYKYIVLTSPPPPVTPVVPRSLKLGVSYLKESGRRGTTAPSVGYSDIKSGNDIINNNNILNLSFRPITSTGEVEVRINNIVMAYGVDYVFPTVESTATGTKVYPPIKLPFINDIFDTSDGLKTGTIYFYKTISPTDEISVSYNYYKSSQGRFSGIGGAEKKYYIQYARNIIPGGSNDPFGGGVTVQIRNKNDVTMTPITLNPNPSFEATNVTQYSVNFSDSPDLPYITFNDNPIKINNTEYRIEDISFTIIYKYVPQISGSEKPISHDVVGFDSNFKVGDYLNLETSYARSKTDQVYTTASTSESFNGDGTKRVFTLNSRGQIIDGSEQVYMNNIKLNRDDQYSILYDSNSAGKYGVITFLYSAPATTDSISIDYNYQTTGGLITTINEKQGNAYKVGASIKPLSNIELAADYKKVDADFAPMGGISIPLGSDYKHAYTKVAPFPTYWSSFWMSGDLKEINTPLSNLPDKFLHSYDRNFLTGFNPNGVAQVDFGFREYVTLDDLVSGSKIHNNDYKSQAYSLSIVPKTLNIGEFSFANRNDGRKTLAYTDTEDKVLPKDTLIDYYHTNNTFDFTKRVRWVLDYQVNLPSTISYEAGSRVIGKTIERRETDDISSNLNWDLTFGGIKRFYTYWNKMGHNDNDFILGTVNSTINETYHADFIPIDQITTSVDHNRQETPTISTVYGNPKSERSAANIRVTPYSLTSFGWSGSKDDALQENGIRTSGNANTYSIDHTPISGTNYKLITKYNLSVNLRNAPSGTEEVSTDTRTFGQDYTITYDPINIWSVSTGFGQEDYTNKNNSLLSPIDTKSQSQTTRTGTTYKLSSDLDLSGNYSVKVTRTPDQSAHKSLVDGHAIYKVFSYGTINYDWSQEDNGGEILGGIYVSQDFSKIMQSLSINIALPQSEQMILSSILFRAAVKWASFKDRIAPDNSFQATLLSFEGTFNF
jgi:hypothetical protein